jgi:hypothetical protein
MLPLSIPEPRKSRICLAASASPASRNEGGVLDTEKRSLKEIAGDFFAYLGRNFPQQCASDEFYFLPRAEIARNHLDTLDSLTPEKIHDHIRYVKDLLREVPPQKANDLEEEIDRRFLTQIMESFIREFAEAEVWRNDPTLYVKIPLFATDQVVSQKERAPEELRARLLTLFSRIPSFLGAAIHNLDSPSEVSLQVAVSMIQDALHFYHHDIRAFIKEKVGDDMGLGAKHCAVVEAWEDYMKGLQAFPSRKSFAIGENALDKIIRMSLSYHVPAREILEIARHAYLKTQEKYIKLARSLEKRTARRGVAYKAPPSVRSPAALLQLYQREVRDLRRFFLSRDIITFPPGEGLSVRETPYYLRSLRATASYRAPLTGNTREHGTFYLTPGEEDLALIARHCPYLSAHETYPGHHILDHLRIHHANPIRRQIESPLFYEGWACYAEQLLDELGYVKDPRQQLIQLMRQMWRCIRAMLDVELQTGKIVPGRAAKKLQALGFSSQRAQRQVRRFCLSPGYQLCYFIGMQEIIRLRKKFASRLGLKLFHDTLLGGGEIPFYLVEKRLEATAYKKVVTV